MPTAKVYGALRPEDYAKPYDVAGYLAAGRLVELIPGTPLDIALHWQFARRTAPALEPLTRALRTAAKRVLLA